MSTDKTIACKVAEMPLRAKQSLEGILGAPLDERQEVIIMAYTPGVAPFEATREAAQRRVAQLLAKVDAHAVARGITMQEADTAIDEVVVEVRRR